MCGLFGIYRESGGIRVHDLTEPLRVLNHRGPDQTGTWLDATGCCALGHTRLSIMDPEGGRQPLFNEDQSVGAVVNGEFYGFEEIRDNLEDQGHRFRTRSDSEVLVHLYEEYGFDCLHRLRGEFAFILWDSLARRVFAGRDRFGVKPLCYHVLTDGVLLASEAKAIFAAGIEPAWDREGVHLAASLQYLTQGRTLFEGVRQVPPGHYLVLEESRVSLTRYWDLDFPLLSDRRPCGDRRALAIDLKSQVLDAVRVRMRSDVPVGFHLSGGIDSSTIVALAHEVSAAPGACFTVGFDESAYDELDLAVETAQKWNVHLRGIPVSQDELIAHLSDAAYFSEGLAVNAHLAAKFILSRFIRDEGYKVILSGEGADEILYGYPHFTNDLVRMNSGSGPDVDPKLAGQNWVSSGIMLADGLGIPLDFVKKEVGFVPTFLRSKSVLGTRVRSLMRGDHLESFRSIDVGRSYLGSINVEEQLRGRHPLDQASYLWCKSALPNYILKTLGDGLEMAHSVEGRVPFLDHWLFEFVKQIPPEEKIRGGVEKCILREAMKPQLTERVFARRKHPFYAPPFRVIGSGLDVFREVLTSDAGRAQPFFDVDRVLNLLNSIDVMSPADRAIWDPPAFMALTTCLIQARFNPR